MDQLLVVLVGVALLLVVSVPRYRDQREYAAWWRAYEDRERLRKLQVAWSAGFRRGDAETEDDYIKRYDAWFNGTLLDEEYRKES